MKYNGCKYECMIDGNNRLYNGVQTAKEVIPKPLPDNEVLFDEFPLNTNGGIDYVWDGKELKYDPLPVAEAISESVSKPVDTYSTEINITPDVDSRIMNLEQAVNSISDTLSKLLSKVEALSN